MQISYLAPLSKAWDRMQNILFRPFEIKKWFVRMIGSWVFMIQIMVIMYSKYLFGSSFVSAELMTPLLLVLSFPIIFIFGLPTLKLGLRGLYKFYFNMDSLISLGTPITIRRWYGRGGKNSITKLFRHEFHEFVRIGSN